MSVASRTPFTVAEPQVAHIQGSIVQTHPSSVVRRALHSVMVLGVRQALTVLMSFLGGILLARLLSPAEFGLYAIVTFLLAFLTAFGDVGLAASLVRQPHEPAEEDYQAVFTFQQVLVGSVVVISWFTAPLVAQAYHLPQQDRWVFRLVALSLLCTSFQVISSARLERHLRFDKLAIVEVAMSFVFYGTVVLLAWQGVGTLSFGIAMFARSLTGAVLVNCVSPWRIRWRWDLEGTRSHLRFGLPYQGTALISLLTSSFTPIFVGLMLGASSVGYVNWAQMVSGYPVVALMVMQRVYLPAFARLQLDKESLRQFVEMIIRAANVVAAPLAVLTLVCIDPLTRFVFGQKWLPAISLFYLLWGTNLFVPTATPVFALLNALGYSRSAFKFSLMWMIGMWVLGAPLIFVFGPIGFGIAGLCVNVTNVALYRVAQSHLSFRVFRMIAPAWGLALTMGLSVLIVMQYRPPNGLNALMTYMALGFIAYSLPTLLFYRSDFRKVWMLVGRPAE